MYLSNPNFAIICLLVILSISLSFFLPSTEPNIEIMNFRLSRSALAISLPFWITVARLLMSEGLSRVPEHQLRDDLIQLFSSLFLLPVVLRGVLMPMMLAPYSSGYDEWKWTKKPHEANLMGLSAAVDTG